MRTSRVGPSPPVLKTRASSWLTFNVSKLNDTTNDYTYTVEVNGEDRMNSTCHSQACMLTGLKPATGYNVTALACFLVGANEGLCSLSSDVTVAWTSPESKLSKL